MNRIARGFSLIEIMIVLAIVTILVTVAYPSYAGFVRKANRAEAQAELLDWANRQEIWRADNISYNPGINPSDTEYYTYTIVSDATSFTLTATAVGTQVKDEDAGVSCIALTLDEAGTSGPAGHEKCWRKQ